MCEHSAVLCRFQEVEEVTLNQSAIESDRTAPLRVLHIIATGQRRGGELFASDLVAALGALGVWQHVAVIRGESLDVSFAAPVSRLRSGREIPALRLNITRVRDLVRLMRTARPHVIQAHGGESLKYSMAVSAAGSVPIVYRRIGSVHGWTEPGLRRSAHGLLMRRAACVVAVAEEMRREAVDIFGVPTKKVVVIPNAVDPERIRATAGRSAVRSALGISESAPLVMWIGALSPEKDPFAVLALAEMLSADPEAVFVLAGSGPLEHSVRSTIEGRGLKGRVRLLGPRTDVGDLLASSDVLLMTSRTEGMPAAVIEAGMHGVPVVAVNVGGVEDVVVDDETGILVPLGDRRALAASLDRVLHDRELRLRLGRAARRRCASTFDIRVVAPGYLKVYEEVLGRPSTLAAQHERGA